MPEYIYIVPYRKNSENIDGIRTSGKYNQYRNAYRTNKRKMSKKA